jgi:hypothetical protein
MKRKQSRPKAPEGTIRTTIQIPEALHEAVKALRRARYKAQGSDVKLCLIYTEAVQQYVNARPQQNLLNGTGNGSEQSLKSTA